MTVRLPQSVEDAIESLSQNWTEEQRQQLRQSLLETAARALAREQEERLAQQLRDALNGRIQAQVLREQQEISEQVGTSTIANRNPVGVFSQGNLPQGLGGIGSSIPVGVLRADNFTVRDIHASDMQLSTRIIANRNPVPARGNRAYNPELPSYDPPAEDEE